MTTLVKFKNFLSLNFTLIINNYKIFIKQFRVAKRKLDLIKVEFNVLLNLNPYGESN